MSALCPKIEHMFESSGGASAAVMLSSHPDAEVPGDGVVLDTATLAAWAGQLARLDRGVDDAERIEQIRLMEELKSTLAAAQAVVTVDLVDSQRAEQRAAGVSERDMGQGVAAQVALARRESPHRGSRLVGLALALVHEMPATMTALRAGKISEWRATIVARETACLSREDRQVADGELAGRLPHLGDRQTEAAARAVAYRLDPHAFTARSAAAARDRRVTLRPAPDTMSRLAGLLPVAQGIAAYTALSREADARKVAGDARSRGQIMADTLVERLTGQAAAEAVPVEVELVMTDRTPARRSRRARPPGRARPASLRRSPANWSAAQRQTCGCAGFSPAPRLARSSRWNPAGGCSPTGCDGSSCCATRPAAPPGAGHPSATPTTSSRSRRAGRPAPATAKACAKRATTPNKPPAGQPDPATVAPGRACRSPHPPVTPTPADPHPHQVDGRAPQTSTGARDHPRDPRHPRPPTPTPAPSKRELRQLIDAA